MAKITIVPLGSMENQTTFVQTLNDNLEAIAQAFELILSRDGTTPNQMEASLDMNSKRIINLPSPVGASDPARLIDLVDAQAIPSAVLPSLTGNTNKLLSNDGSVLVWQAPASIPGFGDLLSTNNLDDLDNVVTARTNLGLGTSATYNISTSGSNIPVLNAANTWSALQTFSGGITSSGALTLSGTADHRLTASSTSLTPESLGYRGTPVTTQDASYQFVLNDSGRTTLHTSGTGHSYTIPANATVAFPLGTVLIIINQGAGAVTIARGGGVTLRRAGSATDANLSVAQWGYASLVKVGTDSWVASGVNLS